MRLTKTGADADAQSVPTVTELAMVAPVVVGNCGAQVPSMIEADTQMAMARRLLRALQVCAQCDSILRWKM